MLSLEAKQFKPSKSQRSIVNRFNTFIRDGGKEGQPGWVPAALPSSQATADAKGKGRAKPSSRFDLRDSLRASEDQQDTKHNFQVELVPAEFTKERYMLYKKYQMEIHKDKESKLSEDGFRRFLCESPLRVSSGTVPLLDQSDHAASSSVRLSKASRMDLFTSYIGSMGG